MVPPVSVLTGFYCVYVSEDMQKDTVTTALFMVNLHSVKGLIRLSFILVGSI